MLSNRFGNFPEAALYFFTNEFIGHLVGEPLRGLAVVTDQKFFIVPTYVIARDWLPCCWMLTVMWQHRVVVGWKRQLDFEVFVYRTGAASVYLTLGEELKLCLELGSWPHILEDQRNLVVVERLQASELVAGEHQHTQTMWAEYSHQIIELLKKNTHTHTCISTIRKHIYIWRMHIERSRGYKNLYSKIYTIPPNLGKYTPLVFSRYSLQTSPDTESSQQCRRQDCTRIHLPCQGYKGKLRCQGYKGKQTNN